MTSFDRRFIAFLVVYTLALGVLPLTLSDPDFHWLFSETGPVEILSLVFWVVAAIVVLVSVRPATGRTWAFAVMYLVFAAREADLHRAFTADSMLKSGYYRHVAAPLPEKIIAGLVAIAILALLLYFLWVSFRFLFAQGGWRTRSGAWLLAALALIFFVKVLDRAPATLEEDYGIVISRMTDRYAAAYEEGLEMVLPLLFAVSAGAERRKRRYL